MLHTRLVGLAKIFGLSLILVFTMVHSSPKVFAAENTTSQEDRDFTVSINDEQSPLATKSNTSGSVSVLNFIFTITTVVLASTNFIKEDASSANRKRVITRSIVILLGAASVATLILTTDIHGYFRAVNSWTPLLLGLSAGTFLFTQGRFFYTRSAS